MNIKLKLLIVVGISLFLLTSLFSGYPSVAQIDDRPLPDGVQTIPFDFIELQDLKMEAASNRDEQVKSTTNDVEGVLNVIEDTPTGLLEEVQRMPIYGQWVSVGSDGLGLSDFAQTTDFNNDGLVDLIYHENEFNGPQIKIYNQLSEGGFEIPKFLNIGYGPWAIGDVNNDGLMDVVYIKIDSAFVGFSMYIQQATGEFTFQQIEITETLFSLTQRFEKIIIVDVNEDGSNDIAMLVGRGEFTKAWYAIHSDGEGGFQTDETQYGDVLINYTEALFSIKNIDTEPKDEIMLGHVEGSQVVLKIGRFISNTFTQTQVLDHTIEDLEENNDSHDLDIVDINSDGLDDLVFMVSQPSDTWILIWEQTVEGMFEGPVTIHRTDLNYEIDYLAVADIDNDGIKDMALMNVSGKKLRLVFMSDTWEIKHEIREDIQTWGPLSLFELQDFNSDGLPDLLIGFSVYYHSAFVNFVFLPTLLEKFVRYLDFSDDFSNPKSGWPVFDNANITLHYIDEEYSIVNKNSDFIGFATPGFPANYYDLNVTARKVGSAKGGYGVVVESDRNSAYFKGIVVFPDFGVTWLIDVGDDGRLRILDEYRSSRRPDSRSPYNFRVNRQDTDRFSLEVYSSEGSYSKTFWPEMGPFDRSTPHHVGFITLPLDDGFEARFDDFDFVQHDIFN